MNENYNGNVENAYVREGLQPPPIGGSELDWRKFVAYMLLNTNRGINDIHSEGCRHGQAVEHRRSAVSTFLDSTKGSILALLSAILMLSGIVSFVLSIISRIGG